MLERLDDIPWRELRDAYGPSVDTPGCIRALASDSPRKRSSALKTLWGTIWHQGTVYDATVEAVPFLIELLREPSVAGKADVLELLAAIASGNGYWQVHKDLILHRDKAKTPEVQNEIRAEERRLARIAERVNEGLNVYIGLLADADDAVRQNAINLLTELGGNGDVIATALDRVSRDTAIDPRTRAAALAARLGMNDGGWEMVDAALSDGAPPVLQAAAAVSAVMKRGAAAGRSAVERCQRLAACEDDSTGEPLAVFGPWETVAIVALRTGAVPVNDETLVRLAEAFVQHGERSEHRASALLGIAFPDGPAPQPPDEITYAQRRCIEAVCMLAFPKPNAVWINFTDALKSVGLPDARKEIETYLGAPLPPGILEKAYDGRKSWWRFW